MSYASSLCQQKSSLSKLNAHARVCVQVSAALASNAEVLTVDSIQALGQSCTGLSTAQISGAGGQVLFNALSVLSLVQEWNLDQAMMIIRTLLSSGVYQVQTTNTTQSQPNQTSCASEEHTVVLLDS